MVNLGWYFVECGKVILELARILKQMFFDSTIHNITQQHPKGHTTSNSATAYIQTTSKCASMDAQHASKTHGPKNTLLSSNIANMVMGFVQEKLDAQHASRTHTKNLRKTQCTKTLLLFDEGLDV